MNQLYYRFPTTNGINVVFGCDNDLWIAPIEGGVARRLTSNLSTCYTPRFSPDGTLLAFIASDDGDREVYLMDGQGGPMERLTYEGMVLGIRWKSNSELIIFTASKFWHAGEARAFVLNLKTRKKTDLPWGAMADIAQQDQTTVIGRYQRDSARWKRYGGGTAGVLWVSQKGKPFKRILKDIKASVYSLQLFKNRIFFISDHEGHGNIYSCSLSGLGLKRHTHFSDYYIRQMEIKDGVAVFQAAGILYSLDLGSDHVKKIEIQVYTNAVEYQRRYADADEYLSEVVSDSTGEIMAVISRGQLFSMQPWLGGYAHHGEPSAIRHSSPTWRDETELFVVGTNEEREDELLLIDTDKNKTLHTWKKSSQGAWGKIWSLSCSPDGKFLTVVTNRGSLFLVDTKTYKVSLVDQSQQGRFRHVNWSPHSRYITYTATTDKKQLQIRVYDLKNKSKSVLVENVHHDWGACFSQCGRYVFFISTRDFETNFSNAYVNLHFIANIKPYVVTLQKGTESLFDRSLYDFEEDDNDDDNKKKKKKQTDLDIDFEDINTRIEAFPVKAGEYANIQAANGKIFIQKCTEQSYVMWSDALCADNTDLYTYSFEEDKFEKFCAKVGDYQLVDDAEKVLLIMKDDVRLVATDSKPKEEATKHNKKDGLLNLEKLKVEIQPIKEWQQMYDEAWVLQREHFWDHRLGGIDWEEVYHRYLPVLERVRTREELSDLIWEMQGELGTSHCYEMDGDYPFEPYDFKLGYLGIEAEFISPKSGYKITRFYEGDIWKKSEGNPLRRAGVELQIDDCILAVDGRSIKQNGDLEKFLVNKAGETIDLLVKRKGKTKSQLVSVKTLKYYRDILYRDWVNKNKEYVNKKSNGKIGYIHIPNMGFPGYTEFYRHFLAECKKDALLVDLRYNGGGFVSQFLLRELSQKLIGFDFTRYEGYEHYPFNAVNGPMVALTNELAGSDGDIFSHSFKLFGLGKLIGKRTWGGVVGINGQYQLVDGSYITQPEYSFWFKDVGFNVENYGTDPDIEVENSPDDYAKGIDAQLDRSIAELKKQMKSYKKLVALKKNVPKLRAPKLPRKLK